MQTIFATTNLLSALGIDWKLLVEQSIAFLILVAILAKYVYPVLVKSIDDRREAIQRGLQEAQASHEELARAEAKIETMLAEARREADDIVARSHQEAAALVGEAETKAKARAEQLVADARVHLEADVQKARQALKKDTAQLVALATERIIRDKMDSRKDAELIERTLSRERA